MKYAVNHPQRFRPIKKKLPGEKTHPVSYAGAKRRAFCAFLLGFAQSSIAIVAEVLVIVYLSSLTSLLLIIMKYVSLAAVVKFDDMFGAALHEHGILGAGGKALKITNTRQGRFNLARQ